MTSFPRSATVPLALLLAATLAACASTSGVEPSRAQLRDAASLGVTASVTQASEPASDPRWWQAFGDPQLDRLVDQALADSPSLRLAAARLDRARAVLGLADAALLPQVNATAEATRQRYTARGQVPAPLAGAIRETGLLQLGATWELDFFGKYQAALDAALGSARAAQADAGAARVLLAGNVVRAYLQLARAQAQLDVAGRTLAQREQALRLVNDRVSAGLDSRLELRQSEGAVPEARQQIEALREQEALARNALAALIGRPGQDPVDTPVALSAMRPLPQPTAIPADLLGRRPDIAAARWRVEAARHDIDNARAQFYPNINLVAFAGLSSIGLGKLLDAGAQQWGIGPALRLPVFDAGRLRANLRGRNADLDAAVESYNGAVIDAVREVADQLAAGRGVARQQAEQRQAQEAAEAAYGLALQRYEAGLGNYLQVLSAESTVLAQRRLGVDLAVRALEAQAGLARALGGGWQDHEAVAAGQEPSRGPEAAPRS